MGIFVVGQILYVGDGEDSYVKDVNLEEEWVGYVLDLEEGWLEVVELLGVEEEEDSLQEFDQVCQFWYDLEYNCDENMIVEIIGEGFGNVDELELQSG